MLKILQKSKQNLNKNNYDPKVFTGHLQKRVDSIAQ